MIDRANAPVDTQGQDRRNLFSSRPKKNDAKISQFSGHLTTIYKALTQGAPQADKLVLNRELAHGR